jgi:hypothetical protein
LIFRSRGNVGRFFRKNNTCDLNRRGVPTALWRGAAVKLVNCRMLSRVDPRHWRPRSAHRNRRVGYAGRRVWQDRCSLRGSRPMDRHCMHRGEALCLSLLSLVTSRSCRRCNNAFASRHFLSYMAAQPLHHSKRVPKFGKAPEIEPAPEQPCCRIHPSQKNEHCRTCSFC